LAPVLGVHRRALARACAFPRHLQPFSQKSHTPTVAKEFQIGLYDPAVADLELFCNSWSAGFLGERLYVFLASRLAKDSPRRVHRHDNDCA